MILDKIIEKIEWSMVLIQPYNMINYLQRTWMYLEDNIFIV